MRLLFIFDQNNIIILRSHKYTSPDVIGFAKMRLILQGTIIINFIGPVTCTLMNLVLYCWLVEL